MPWMLSGGLVSTFRATSDGVGRAAQRRGLCCINERGRIIIARAACLASEACADYLLLIDQSMVWFGISFLHRPNCGIKCQYAASSPTCALAKSVLHWRTFDFAKGAGLLRFVDIDQTYP